MAVNVLRVYARPCGPSTASQVGSVVPTASATPSMVTPSGTVELR